MQKDEKKELVRTIDEMIKNLKELKIKAKAVKTGKYTTNNHDFILRETDLLGCEVRSLIDRTFYCFSPEA